ncbi:ATP-binding protein [Spirosoma endophyticum]|uniref:Anti-sigma regulatory factor (Ser/Thr protein kinase) n=1 Tax=Spirosoma endophyticum TaxID=662367 RepID=A0A1I1ISQ9_9BACT|nr:ATP-binding protein [Spirosoma endophyticum]SFC36783.1 Anti-sigma regulatory factor (Ser/Thr protein kinase) [Spirosoma endophyticum]
MERKTFPGTLDSLEGIRQEVKEESQRVGLSKKATYNLLLAIDEIATNIIMHGYEENDKSGVIDLQIDHRDNQIEVTLEDDAPPFDPLQHTLPTEEFFNKPLEERPIGGMGIHLTINAVDKFRYEFANQRNRNIFVVKVGDA